MNDEVFARLVAEEVKNKVSDQQIDYLRLPENWTRWQRCLNTLIENLNDQLDDIDQSENRARETYTSPDPLALRLLAESMAESEARRRKIVRFRFHVETRFDEVSRMIALGSDAVDERLKTVDFLRKAIEQHKKMVLEEFDPTPVDSALWAILDGKWEFDNIGEDF